MRPPLSRGARGVFAAVPFAFAAVPFAFAAVPFAFATVLLAAACGGMPGSNVTWVPPETPRTRDGLDLVTENPHFQLEYVKPGLDFFGYDAVMAAPLRLAYTPGWKRDHRFEYLSAPYEMVPEERLDQDQAEDLARLRDLFRKALEKELTADGAYRLVDEPGPGVLALSANVVNLDLRLADVDYAGGISIDYSVTPIALIDASLKDAHKGTLLAEMLDPSQGPDDLDREGQFWDGMDDAFHVWAKRLRQMLDDDRRTQTPKQ